MSKPNLLQNLAITGIAGTVILAAPMKADAALISSTGNLSGTVNGLNISGSIEATGDTNIGFIQGSIMDIAPTEVAAIIHINSLVCWHCASAAMPMGAQNLFDITGGDFNQSTTYTFDTGENLARSADVDLVNPNTLFADVQLSGTAPTFDPLASIIVDDYSEFWTQVDPQTISMLANRTFSVDGASRSYTEETIITYNTGNTLPTNQVRTCTDITVNYDETNEIWSTSCTSVVKSTPEPTSALSFLALGTLGAASTLKRKLKPSKSIEKEVEKVL